MQFRRLAILVAAIAVGAAGLAGAQNAIQGEPTAVAVADVNHIFDNLEQRNVVEAEIRQRSRELNQQAQQRQQQIQSLREDLEVLNPGTSAYREVQDELMEAQIDMQIWGQVQEQRMGQEEAMQMHSLYREIVEAVERVATNNGYDIVLYKEGSPELQFQSGEELRAQIQMRKVLHASDEVDITEDVLQRMNNEFEAAQ